MENMNTNNSGEGSGGKGGPTGWAGIPAGGKYVIVALATAILIAILASL